MKASRFEDLVAWQKARELTRAVYRLTRSPSVRSDYGLANQLQRAAVSTMANIAEGFERTGAIEFRRFLSIAKASCGEVRSLLYVVGDANLSDPAAIERLLRQAEEVSRMIAGLQAALTRSLSED